MVNEWLTGECVCEREKEKCLCLCLSTDCVCRNWKAFSFFSLLFLLYAAIRSFISFGLRVLRN